MSNIKDKAIIGIFVVVFLAVLAVGPLVHFGTMETVAAQVLDKERVVKKDDSFYLIFTDRETFKNVDSLLSFKFNSSDVYGRIGREQNCEFTVTGFRVPFLSMYRNIIDAQCEARPDGE